VHERVALYHLGCRPAPDRPEVSVPDSAYLYHLASARGNPCQETRDQKVNEMSSIGYHEPLEELSIETREMHRAIVSLMEELEAVDWYNQRSDACHDVSLKAILEHNRDEEKEHASMLLEWIQRKDPSFSSKLKDYLFTDKPIAHQ
jgi:ferritin-like protein